MFCEVTTVHGRTGDCIHSPQCSGKGEFLDSRLRFRLAVCAHARHNFKVDGDSKSRQAWTWSPLLHTAPPTVHNKHITHLCE